MNGIVSTVLALCDADKCKETCDDFGSTLLKCKVCGKTGRSYRVVEEKPSKQL